MESKASAPQTMWQVVLDKPGHQNIDCRRMPIPVPKKDEVLVKVLAAPINPRDYYIMLAKDLPFPLCPGDQGSGVVVRSGGGFTANRLVGKRVAFFRYWSKHSTGPPNGSYSEYCIVGSNFAFQIDKSIADEQAACTLINPVSALGLMERLKQLKAKTVVQTGAASQIAKMMIRLAPLYKMRFINIVRRQEQVDHLKEEFKQEYVLNSSDPDFLKQFNALAHELNAKHCLECVSGEMTGNLLNNMPEESTIIVYGSLSLSRIGNINPRHFIYKGHKIQGFVLTQYIKKLSLFGKYLMFRKLKSLLKNTLSSSVSREFGLHELKDAIQYYDKNQSAGKVMMKASLIPDDFSSKL